MTRNRTIIFTVFGIITIVCIIAMVTKSGLVTALLSNIVTLPNVGSVKASGVGVYWDSGCSNTVTSVNWGTVAPGSTNDVTVYIKNEGNTAATLSSSTENWDPSIASTYMSLTWDYAGQVIDVGAVVQVTLSLTVSDTLEGVTSFSFDIVIVGSD